MFIKALEYAIEFGMSMYAVYTAYVAVISATNPGFFGLSCHVFTIYEARQIDLKAG